MQCFLQLGAPSQQCRASNGNLHKGLVVHFFTAQVLSNHPSPQLSHPVCHATSSARLATLSPWQDKFLILASDGVWEFIDAQTAVELVADCPNAEQACRLVRGAAGGAGLVALQRFAVLHTFGTRNLIVQADSFLHIRTKLCN